MIHFVVTDIFNQAYELTDRYSPPRSSAAQRHSYDAYFTFSLVNKLCVTPEQWLQILQHALGYVPHFHSSHPGEVYQAVSESVMRGDLVIYQLPHITDFGALRGKHGVGLCIIRGPNPHCATDLTPEICNNPAAAKQLLDELGISDKAFLVYLNSQSLYNSYQKQNPLADALNLLASGELLAYKVPLPASAPPPKAVEFLPATTADKPVPLAPETASATAPETKNSESKPEEKKTELDARKGVEPKSLEDAADRLDSMKKEIDVNGYKPKYTDQELLQQAQTGDVAKERYHVRFMEVGHQWDRSDAIKDSNNLTGKLGREFSGATGTGPRYWSTTFDQIEDADSDPRLICRKLGIDHDPSKKYAMVIIDTKKAKPLTGCECVSATFGNISAFANRELPSEFPKSFTDKVMTHEFQVAYKDNYQKALDGNFLKSEWSTDTTEFSNYLNTTGMNNSEKDLMLNRMVMHDKIGNNNHYLGNGVTEDKIPSSPNKCGAVETHNFERTPTDLQKLKDNNAIKIVYL